MGAGVDCRQRACGILLGAGLDVPAVARGALFRRDVANRCAGVFFRAIFLLGATITALLSIDSEGVGRRGEDYALMLFSALGMDLMVSAADLVMLDLAMEMTTIPLYLLAGYLKRDSRSTEAGLKYFLFGATASAVMLYGFSLIYGLHRADGFARGGRLRSTAEQPRRR